MASENLHNVTLDWFYHDKCGLSQVRRVRRRNVCNALFMRMRSSYLRGTMERFRNKNSGCDFFSAEVLVNGQMEKFVTHSVLFGAEIVGFVFDRVSEQKPLNGRPIR
jgi:hypothetical protein